MMKRRLSIGLGILAVAAAVPFVSGTPVFANLQKAGTELVNKILQPEVKLVLSAEKKSLPLMLTVSQRFPGKRLKAMSRSVPVMSCATPC